MNDSQIEDRLDSGGVLTKRQSAGVVQRKRQSWSWLSEMVECGRARSTASTARH
jgi:hypothetical protein